MSARQFWVFGAGTRVREFETEVVASRPGDVDVPDSSAAGDAIVVAMKTKRLMRILKIIVAVEC